jgi:mono/diheme cytochrome c family protein
MKTVRIEIYLDDNETPIKVIIPPEKFKLETESIPDGEHTLVFRTIADDKSTSQRLMNFKVHNGPAIAVHGIRDGDTLSGNIDVLVNAYGSHIGDEFEPGQIETPAPVPTWAWVLALVVIGWGAGYLSTALTDEFEIRSTVASSGRPNISQASDSDASFVLGEQIYGNNCSSCHQQSGTGLSGVFPSLVNNPAVMADDPTGQINAILHGLANKVIDGVAYAAAMPPFGNSLTDEDIAAVVNHVRRSWGNSSPPASSEQVADLRINQVTP